MSERIEYITADNLNSLTNDIINSGQPYVFHGFFTRKVGVSSGVYKGLNCGIGSGDKKEDIIQNRNLVSSEIGIKPDHLLGLYQEHGSKVITVNEPWIEQARPHADGLVCDKAGIAISILTADCAPVLFLGTKENGAPVIGAAHAGWKGALYGVVEKTIDAMQALGAQKESIAACIGPCISQASYEVGSEFVDNFIRQDDTSIRFFATKEKSNSYFDLSGYCRSRLKSLNIGSIYSIDENTYTQEYKFFSYRRATHRSEKDYGRQISVISIPKIG